MVVCASFVVSSARGFVFVEEGHKKRTEELVQERAKERKKKVTEVESMVIIVITKKARQCKINQEMEREQKKEARIRAK